MALSIQIVIDISNEGQGSPGVARTFPYTKLSETPVVTLSLASTSGVTSYNWSLVDIPEGSAAVLSSSTAATPTFSPDVRGTYLVQCTVNDGQAYARNAIAFTTENQALRIPAAGETLEFDSTSGWKDALTELFDSVDSGMGSVSAHALAGVIHTADTLANLNSKITDAVLDDASDPRDPNAHALAGAAHSADTLANLNAKITDATLDDSSATRDPNAHTLGGAAHSSDTLANLNAKITDATLDDSSSPRTDSNAIHDNVSAEISALTEKTTPVDGDWFIIEDSEAANVKKKVQVGNLPGGSTVLWEWNGADITQFGDGVGTPDNTYGSPDGTLSVGAVPTSNIDVPSGDVLIYTTGSATGAHAHFLINDLPTLPERFIMRARLGPKTGGVTCEPFLIFAEQDELHWVGTAYSTGGTLQLQLGNNRDGLFTAAHFISFGAVSNVDSGVVIEADIMLRDPSSGVDPQVNVIAREARAGVLGYGRGGTAWSSFGSPPAIWDSSWQTGGTIKQLGIGFLCNGASLTAWVGELQILSHPWTNVA